MAASPSSVEPPKHWFFQSMDIFTTVDSNESVEFSWFEKEIKELAKTIHRFAIKKFQLSSFLNDFEFRLTFDRMLEMPQAVRVAYLAQSDLFKKIVVTAQPTISARDSKRYQEIFIQELFEEYETGTKKDLSHLKISISIIRWTHSVVQTIFKPKELSLMCHTYDTMGQALYQETKDNRMQITSQLDSSTLCIAIKQLLKITDVKNEKAFSLDYCAPYLYGFFNGSKKTPADERIVSVAYFFFTEYLSKIVYTIPPDDREAVKQHLMLSLKIRARRLA